MTTTTAWSPTDPHTWVALLSVVAAVVTSAFHVDLGPWIPAAAVLAAGLVVGLIALGKHHYASALAAVATAAAGAAPLVPHAAPAAASTSTTATPAAPSGSAAS